MLKNPENNNILEIIGVSSNDNDYRITYNIYDNEIDKNILLTDEELGNEPLPIVEDETKTMIEKLIISGYIVLKENKFKNWIEI